mmetsp:Transcript_24032/g.59741  ORF Transcript_24032/g.59741 Transcript_24032/m.59741 type:complete len:103 (+) Transcript_24032:510-818(+)
MQQHRTRPTCQCSYIHAYVVSAMPYLNGTDDAPFAVVPELQGLGRDEHSTWRPEVLASSVVEADDLPLTEGMKRKQLSRRSRLEARWEGGIENQAGMSSLGT